jgi:hypothetical protein
MYYGPDYKYGLSKRRQGWDLGLLDAWGSERKVVTAGEADNGSTVGTRALRLRGTSVCDGCTGPWCEPRGWQGGGLMINFESCWAPEADQDPLRKYLQYRDQ